MNDNKGFVGCIKNVCLTRNKASITCHVLHGTNKWNL